MIEARHYRKGEAALIPVTEEDPFAGWSDHVERSAKRLISVDRDGSLVAVMGYIEVWDGVADAFALIDREKAAGAGKELAAEVKRCIMALMRIDNLHRVQATSEPQDAKSRVFLRATGYKFESVMQRAAPDGSDLAMYTIIRSA
jgi:RimJ/RimL family protein N-acetyltransferase